MGTSISSVQLSRSLNVVCLFKLLEIAQGLEYLHSKNVVHGDLRGVSNLNEFSECKPQFIFWTS
jgi:serine/threonine protein kinase